MLTIKSYVFTVLFLCSAKQLLGDFKAYFPRSSDTMHPRLIIGALPTLNEFTFCSWVRLFNLNNMVPHIFSYSTTRADDEIAVFFRITEKSVLSALQMRSQSVRFNCSFIDWTIVSWHHICTSWLGADGNVKFFVDGQRCSVNGRGYRPISSGEFVLGGGVAILGQDQDSPGSNFDVHQGWYGDMTSVNLWSEELSENQIREAGKCDGNRKVGTVIAWSKTPMAAQDGVVIRYSEVCE